MPRLLALTGVVVIALVGAGSAQALSEPGSSVLQAIRSDTHPNITRAQLANLLQDIDAQGLQTSGSTNVKTGVTRMQIASGRIAALSTVGKLSTVATGSIVVWQIADALGLGGYVYKKITGHDAGFWGTFASDPSWVWDGTGITAGSGFPAQPANRWWISRNGTAPGTYCTDIGDCASTSSFTGQPEFSTWALGLTGTVVFNTSGVPADGSAACSTGGTLAGECQRKWRSAAEMAATLDIEPSDAAEYASPPVGATTRSGGTNDTTTPTTVEVQAAIDAIDPNPGTAGTAVEEDTVGAILEELDPTWDEGFLLQPLPNETYTQYITRLQEAGWVGDATTTVLATEQAGYGPEAVVRVIATPAGGTTTVYDPLNWPSPAPTIELNSDITLRYNPSTAPEAPTTTTPTPVTGAPTTIPSAPAVDFSPITELDPGCKFPYGFICYAVDFTEQFNVTADAPVFTFNLGWTGMVNGQEEGGEAPYTVDLEVMDDYMALWRGILTVVLWVGAIYLVATRMLGVKFGGDPGEAIDDVL